MSWRTRTPIGDPPTIFQADAILFDSFPPLLLRCTSGLSPGLVAGTLVSFVPRLEWLVPKTLIRRGVADSGNRDRSAQVI
jgi:hypothetical protein